MFPQKVGVVPHFVEELNVCCHFSSFHNAMLPFYGSFLVFECQYGCTIWKWSSCPSYIFQSSTKLHFLWILPDFCCKESLCRHIFFSEVGSFLLGSCKSGSLNLCFLPSNGRSFSYTSCPCPPKELVPSKLDSVGIRTRIHKSPSFLSIQAKSWPRSRKVCKSPQVFLERTGKLKEIGDPERSSRKRRIHLYVRCHVKRRRNASMEILKVRTGKSGFRRIRQPDIRQTSISTISWSIRLKSNHFRKGHNTPFSWLVSVGSLVGMFR